MNSRLRWRSLTRAWTLPVSRSIPANRLSVPWRLYSWSRAKPEWTPGSGGKSGAVVAMAWIPGFSSQETIVTGFARRFPLTEAFFRTWTITIDAQDLRHLLFELGVAVFKIAAHLRLDFLLAEDLAHWPNTDALPPVRARAHGAPRAASSTTHADSRGPSPCRTPATPTRPWPQP